MLKLNRTQRFIASFTYTDGDCHLLRVVGHVGGFLGRHQQHIQPHTQVHESLEMETALPESQHFLNICVSVVLHTLSHAQ